MTSKKTKEIAQIGFDLDELFNRADELLVLPQHVVDAFDSINKYLNTQGGMSLVGLADLKDK